MTLHELESWFGLVDTRLVGRCGLYCGACGIYRAYKDDEDYLKTLAEHFNCPPEKVRCEGCQALTPNCWGSNCKIVECLRAKNLEFCYQCKQYEEYSCEKFENLAKPYLNENGVDLRANLEKIRKGEAEIKAWLKESEEKFRCPECGKPLPSGSFRSKCYHCGTRLSK